MEKKARPASIGKCGHFVMNAIEAGLGEKNGTRPGSAKDMGVSYLPRAGFTTIIYDSLEHYVPEPGDVVVFDAVEGHDDGHAAMMGHDAWYSDFKQRDMYGGSAFRKPGTVFKLYRHQNRKRQ